MTDLRTNRELFILERARRGLAPSAAQREAILGRLRTLAHAPHAINDLTPEATTYSLRALVSGMAGGLVVGFGAGYFATQHHTEHPVQLRPPLVQKMEASTPRPMASVAVASTPVVLPSAARSPRPAQDPVRREPEPVAKSTSDDELSYVQRGQAALRNGNAALALGLMRSLDEAQPKGALAAERAVVRVLALCQLGRVEEARTAAAVAAKQGDALEVYRHRLDRSCVGPIGTSATSDEFGRVPHQ